MRPSIAFFRSSRRPIRSRDAADSARRRNFGTWIRKPLSRALLSFKAFAVRCPAQIVPRFILNGKRHALFAPLRFIWNATRGHRLAPWRSEFLRWRVETYSGKSAETLKARDIFGFVWTSRWELLSFLVWTGRLDREARRRV